MGVVCCRGNGSITVLFCCPPSLCGEWLNHELSIAACYIICTPSDMAEVLLHIWSFGSPAISISLCTLCCC